MPTISLLAIEHPISEHDLVEELLERGADARVRHQHAPHRPYEAEVVRVVTGRAAAAASTDGSRM